MKPVQLDDRIGQLELTARAMSRTQIMAFGPAIKGSGRLPAWRSDFPFWFQGTADVKLTKDEGEAMQRLWTRMLIGLAFAVTGDDVEAPAPALPARASVWQRLKRWDRANTDPERRATFLLEHELGGDVWLATVGIWNAFCADLLADRLEPQLRSDLMTPWRAVMRSIPPA
jgi:hypothetical protein